MTILKGHGTAPGSKSLHRPTVPGPIRARPCRAIGLLLPAAPVSVPKGCGSALSSLRGFGAGAASGCWQGGGDGNALPSQHSPLPSVVFSFWAFCSKSSALRMFSFTPLCRCYCMPSHLPFFLSGEYPQRVLRHRHLSPRIYQHA